MTDIAAAFEAALSALFAARMAVVELQVAARRVGALTTLNAAASAYSELLTQETRLETAHSLDASEILAASARAAKTCGCGRVYSAAEWKGLAFVGVQISRDETTVYRCELRNCVACGSTLGIETQTPTEAPRSSP